jgi:hypothetical protein
MPWRQFLPKKPFSRTVNEGTPEGGHKYASEEERVRRFVAEAFYSMMMINLAAAQQTNSEREIVVHKKAWNS